MLTILFYKWMLRAWQETSMQSYLRGSCINYILYLSLNVNRKVIWTVAVVGMLQRVSWPWHGICLPLVRETKIGSQVWRQRFQGWFSESRSHNHDVQFDIFADRKWKAFNLLCNILVSIANLRESSLKLSGEWFLWYLYRFYHLSCPYIYIFPFFLD